MLDKFLAKAAKLGQSNPIFSLIVGISPRIAMLTNSVSDSVLTVVNHQNYM
jgi:hypothetical protein